MPKNKIYNEKLKKLSGAAVSEAELERLRGSEGLEDEYLKPGKEYKDNVWKVFQDQL
jgi:hypothetical protein